MSDRAERCNRCRFWNPLRDDPGPGDLWECRRLPPVLPTTAYLVADGPDGDPFKGVWPLTVGSDWCGSFEPMVSAPPPITKDPGRGRRTWVNDDA